MIYFAKEDDTANQTEQITQMIGAGEITDAKTIAAFMRYTLYRKSK